MSATELTTASFNDFITRPGAVLVKFWAPWCAPCKMLAPLLDSAAAAAGIENFGQVNLDDHPAIGAQLRVRSLPTVIVYKDGVLRATQMGMMSPAQCKDFLEKAIAE